jgi:hypothetical protein
MSRSSRISLTLTVTGEAAEIMADEIKSIKAAEASTGRSESSVSSPTYSSLRATAYYASVATIAA